MTKVSTPLPENELIYVQAESFSWGVYVEYTGPSLAALLQAGCITQGMAGQCSAASTGRVRKDEYGNRFTKRKRPLKEWPERIEIVRYIYDESRARTLPGVVEHLKETQKESPPPLKSFIERSAAAWAELMGLDEVPRTRDRNVGRYQRHVIYAAVGKLVVPDWNRVMVERLAATVPGRTA